MHTFVIINNDVVGYDCKLQNNENRDLLIMCFAYKEWLERKCMQLRHIKNAICYNVFFNL